MPVNFEYILLLIVAFIPLYEKVNFWLYVIQLKEYKLDRFKEYLSTKQWLSAVFNLWFLIEFPLLILSLSIFFNPLLEQLIFPVIFYLFLIENIFYLWKIFRKKRIIAHNTSRLLCTKITFLIIILLELYFIIFKWFIIFIYLFVLSLSLFSYLFIFISIFLSLLIINYFKNKTYKKAIYITKNTKNVIKIWITWSYWKSSVKEFLNDILANEKNVLKTPKNINTELWVSNLIISKLNNNYDFFIAEMWAYKKWEISKLWKIVNYKYWFLTGIWNQHIWLFWSQQKIIETKFEIFKKVFVNDWILYVNWNNQYINNFIKNRKIDKHYIVKYWTNKDYCDALWEFNRYEGDSLIFDFEYKFIKKQFKTNVLWKHNIINLTWVIACAMDLWIEIDNIQKYLLHLKNPQNTLNITNNTINWFNQKIIDDTYNLSYDWLFAWIDLLNSFEKYNKRILVLDDILELGKDAKTIHNRIWFKIAKESLVDKICFVWVNYKKQLKKWLLEWWFNEDNIITEITEIKEDTIILLEWRKAKNFNLLMNDNV